MLRPLVKDKSGLIRIAATLIFVAVAIQSSSAQEDYGFDVWTTADGLPQNTVNGITQTPNGYLWLATFDGLARFDGVRFTIFDKGNSQGIVNNRFVVVFADKDGAVWASTENGVLTVYRDGTFTSYSTPEGLRESIDAITADAEGRVRIETDENYYYLEEGRFVPAPDRKVKGERTVYFGKSGAKWILARDEVSRHKDGIVTRYPLRLYSYSLDFTVYAAPYEDSSGGLWLAARYDVRRGPLYRLHDGAMTLFTDREIPELKSAMLHSLVEQHDGSFWIIFADTLQEIVPLTFVRFKDGSFTRWQFKEPVTVTSRLIDREGNFWLATYKGLRRFRRQLITALTEKDGLLSNEVYPLLQTDGGEVFIGSVKGVNHYRDGKITELKLNPPSLNKGLVMRGLGEDANGRLLLGSYNSSGRLENDRLKIIAPYGATDFAADRDGNLWLATNEGLFKYKDDREIARYKIENGLPHNEVITIHFDRNGNLWAGTFDGLAQFKDGGFMNFNAVESSPKGFVRYIYEDADGVLWFGTYGDGLVRYKDGKFFNYRVEHGLFNNGVFAILEDARGNFWMSSNRGIHRVSRQELNDFADGQIPKLNSVSYDESDGMLNVECNGGRMPSAIKTRDGQFWFPTMGGVAIVDPEAEQVNPNPPPVVIESISIDRKPVDTQIFQFAIRNPQSAIELGPGQSNLEITYTGMSLVKSTQIKFKYKLEGFEENWVEAGRERTANFSYLPYGEYTFRVIAANANGIWNNEGASVRLIVHKPFYRTMWFIGLIVFAVGGLAFLVFRYRVNQLQAISEARASFARQLIISQEAERQRVAAELHDGLGQSLLVIKNRTIIGKKTIEDGEKTLVQFDEISNATSQALEEVRSIAYNLRPYHLERLGLSQALEAMIENVGEAASLQITSRVVLLDDAFSKTDEVTFYRIVQECLNNIVKHAAAHKVKVAIVQTEREVTATIIDDGGGFPQSEKKSGFGLIGMAERVRMLGGKHTIESQPGKGTSVTVTIPLRQAAA